MPGGERLRIGVSSSAAATSAVMRKNELRVRDWGPVRIDARLNPIPAEGRDGGWNAGQLMSNSDKGVRDGPNHLVFASWPTLEEPTRRAPLHGTGSCGT